MHLFNSRQQSSKTNRNTLLSHARFFLEIVTPMLVGANLIIDIYAHNTFAYIPLWLYP